MHPVYDNIQDKITWFIQGAAKSTPLRIFCRFLRKWWEFQCEILPTYL